VSQFQGEPDKRQEGDIEVSRFRPRYRKLTTEEMALHDLIKTRAEELEELYMQASKDQRYRALATTALEESVMWAIKALTA